SGVEWFGAGLFLVSLILFRHCEKLIRAESAEAYRRLAGGLSLLSLTALARLYQGIGAFQQVPFLSEAVFFDLVYWVIVIAGGAMIVNGAAYWLPLARENKQLNQDKIALLDLIRRIEQLIGVESRLDTILTHALQYMKEASNLGSGLVFKFSTDGTHLRIVSGTPDFDGDVKQLEQAICSRVKDHQATGTTVDLSRLIADCLAQEQGEPAITIPVEVTGRMIGAFAFWSKDHAEPEPDVRLVLQLEADVIARKVATDSLNLRARSREERAAWQENTRVSVEAASDTRLKFAALSKAIAERFQVDTVTLSVMPQKSRVRRFTWTRGDRTLVEHQLPAVSIDSLTGPAFYAGDTVVYHDLSQERRPVREEVLTVRPIGSLAALPIRITEDVTTVLTLTSEYENSITEGIVADIKQLSPLVALLVLPDLLREIDRRKTERLERLAHTLNAIGSGDSRQSSLMALAGLAAEEYDADLIRLSQIDETGMFLESRALVSAGSLRCTVPAHGRIILSLAPIHEQVLKTGLSMVVSRSGDKPGLSGIETTQTLAEGVRHAAIIPILQDGKSIGVITLGAVGHELTETQDSSGLAFAETLAAIAGIYLMSEAHTSISRSREMSRRESFSKAVLPGEADSSIDVNGSVRARVHADIFS
ncbi:MAG: GAF domain-containing protein, partial [candidate division Zixibacteria bacterium]|nr:GAF domain-containing protein [candidate division Zixibacteria bacterium]